VWILAVQAIGARVCDPRQLRQRDTFAINRKHFRVWTLLRLTEPRSEVGCGFQEHVISPFREPPDGWAARRKRLRSAAIHFLFTAQ